ncbi:MAG: DUF4446 family protein, partial [Minisyncoccia bacterium]
LKNKNRELFAGTKSQNLEEALHFYVKQIKDLKIQNKEIENFCNYLNEMGVNSIQKIGLIRFNPFADTGGNQSFALALLNNFNNGVVISSLHGREGTRIYAKPVIAGKSKYNLSTEEIKAIEKAIKSKDSQKE